MRESEIESWALKICDQVVTHKNSVEDSRVELKREWPKDPKKVARRIAGHANASKGDFIIWVIGVDEAAHSVSECSHEELANWWPQVEKHFDELAPQMTDLKIFINGVSLTVLCFETRRPPYVFKDGDKKEVSWREGTRVRAARRSEILLLLSEKSNLPRLRKGKPNLKLTSNYQGGRILKLDAFLYFLKDGRERQVTFPTFDFHACLRAGNIFTEAKSEDIKILPSSNSQGSRAEYNKDAPIALQNTEFIVRECGGARLIVDFEIEDYETFVEKPQVVVHIRLREAMSDEAMEWRWKIQISKSKEGFVTFVTK